MSAVSFTDQGIVVDAVLIGERFGIDPATVPELMRDGTITSRSETGEGEDVGRHRLTFFFRGRALRLTVDSSGRILTNTLVDLPGRDAESVPGTP